MTLPVFVTVTMNVSPGEPLVLSRDTVTPSDVTVSVPETDPVIDESSDRLGGDRERIGSRRDQPYGAERVKTTSRKLLRPGEHLSHRRLCCKRCYPAGQAAHGEVVLVVLAADVCHLDHVRGRRVLADGPLDGESDSTTPWAVRSAVGIGWPAIVRTAEAVPL